MTRALDDVAIVSTWDVPCGIAGFTAGLRNALTDRGVDTTIIPIDRVAFEDLSRAELADAMTALGREAGRHRVVHLQHEFGFYGGSYGLPESIPNFRRVLRSALAEGAERIVTTFHTVPPVRAWPDTGWRAAGRQLVLSEQWRRLVVPAFKPGAQAVGVAPSRYLRRLLVDSGLDAASLRVIPQGAPALAAPADDRAAAKAAVGLDPASTVSLLFGFVAGHKGHHVALEAMRSLPADHHLVVLGGPHQHSNDATYEHLLATLRKRTNLRGRVHVTGWVSDVEVRAWFDAADVCLAPYTDPGLVTSAAAVWALASGRPLIASRIPVFKELVHDWDCAELVLPSAPRTLASAIERVTSDDVRSAELVKHAAAVCDAWAWPHAADAYAALYAGR